MNYIGCLGDYERLEPWLGRCDKCLELHLVDSTYLAPRAWCSSRPVSSNIYVGCTAGRISYITSLPEVAAAFKLGGPAAAWALYCQWHVQAVGTAPRER